MRLMEAMKREVVYNKERKQFGVVMEDGKIEITSYETEVATRSYLGPRVKRTKDWEVLGGAGGAEGC